MPTFPQPWPRFAIAVLTGALWAFSFPKPGIAGFAWTVPGLLLAASAAARPSVVFRVVYIAGLTHYLISLSWLRYIPFPAGAYAGWIFLSLFLALLPPAWALLCWRCAARLQLLPVPDPPNPWRTTATTLAEAPWVRLNLWFLLCATSWVASEMLITRLFGGFPWNLLGASQHTMLPLIQLASATGVYGVSFLVAWFSVSLVTAVTLLAHFPDRTATWRRPLIFPALIIAGLAGGGFFSIVSDAPPSRSLRIALVQPNIPQTVIFDANTSATNQRFETLLQLTQQALATQPDVVLWPEASLPGGLSRENFKRLTTAIRDAKVWMIFGADDADEVPDPSARDGVRTRAYNSSFLLGPDGEIKATYRKRRLVMFGEYVPFGRWFPWLQNLAPIGDGFHPGDRPVPFHLDSLDVTTSSLICFEDNFPLEARDHAEPDVDFLVNLTNNAWFGESSAQWQHAANAIFRAIETGLPLVRSCNNGISCWIDPRGRVRSARLSDGRDVYAAGFEIAQVTFGNRRPTLYQRVGDAFGWACVGITLLAAFPPNGLSRKTR